MKLFYSYLSRYRGLLIACLAFAIINQVFSLLDPIIFQLIIDNYATRFDELVFEDYVWGVIFLLLGMIGVAFVSRTAKTFQDYFVNAISQRIGTEMYADSVQHSFSLPFITFEDRRSGEILTKMQKARDDSQTMIDSFISIVFLALVSMTFVIIYAFYVNWIIGLTYFLMVPILGTFTFLINRKIKDAQTKIVRESAELSGTTTETIRNVELVKSLGLEEQEIERLNKVNEKILGLELNKIKTIRTLGFFQGTAINAMRATLLLIMFILLFEAAITLGQFFSLMFFSFAVFTPLSNFGTFAAQYQQARASTEELGKILAMKPQQKPKDAKKVGELKEIAVKKLDFTYPSKHVPSLSDVSFSIKAGETVAFVGPSGSGKSTMTKLLIGLYEPTQGKVLVNGVDTAKIDYDDFRNKIGLVSQETQLFAGTIRENLRFIKPNATDRECLSAMHAAAIDHIMDNGLDTRIGEGGIKISGGERQRLAIARALLRQPELFIFDEATSSLDSSTEQAITATIQDVMKKHKDRAIISIAHRLSTIVHADRIYVFEKGCIVEQGTHKVLLGKKGLYYALWRQQMGDL